MGANPSDLVRLADLRAVPDPDTDPALQRLITAVSRTILSAINRPSILPRSYTETYEVGRNGLLLRAWPVTRVDAVVVAGVGLLTGYQIDPADEAPPGRPQMLRFGAGTPLGFGGARVTVTYTAGYQVTGEATVVPQDGAVTALQPYGAWASDGSVTDAGDAALTRVASAPAAGQYAVDGTGGYTFAAADAGRPVALTYGYVPADLANAAREWILERQAYAERVGLQSKSLGGQETVSYRIAAVPDFVRPVLQQYASVVPPC
ncbi:hypothetical protein LRS73_26885 [Methylobacterium currus]|uniref:hypothetical protein n=1 Tax=Methylobacterium currus TaxID=2051553 RepID=UPI001E574453|nr:hypothetical protein [Methylobacterium currus]UHC16062.1 hypothetical protein LRS73_26885 [Methylobacterium currus]